MADVIFLAAGKGKRAKLGYPKQLSLLGGKPIMIHSLELFQSMPEVERIIVATMTEKMSDIASLCDSYEITKATIVGGGNTRQESVYNAIQFVTTEKVLIHEAVRPFITKEFVSKIINGGIGNNAVVPGMPLMPTIFDIEKKNYPDRSKLFDIQLPQLFNTALLRDAHETARGQNFTDDSSLFYLITGNMPLFILGLEENIKITTPLDLILAEVIYYERFCDSNSYRSK